MNPSLLDVLRCPECQHGPLVSRGEGLLCSSCNYVCPVRAELPFVFNRAAMEMFFDQDKGVAIPRKAADPHKGGSYHWDVYGFGDLVPEMPPGAKALLLGCGDAGERGPLEGMGFEVLGFDVKRTGGTDFLADAHDIPVMDESFDLVLSSQVLEHLPAPWRSAQEIQRVLKPGGWFVGSVAFLKLYHRSYFHMSHEAVVHLLEPCGLEVKHLSGAQSLTYTIYSGSIPFGSLRLRRKILGAVDDALMGLRAWIWSRKRGISADEPIDTFDKRFRFSFRQFDKLRHAPAVVFTAQKPVV